MKQGHFDIAGLLLRDFLFDSVNFAMDQSIVEVLTAAGNTVRTQKPYMQREFNREIKAAWQRLETLYKLVDEPDAPNGTHRGLYEKQTDHREK